MAKIVIVLNASWNVWNFRLPLLLRLQEDGHDIEVVAPEDEYTDRIPFPFHPVYIHSKSTNPLEDARTFFHILRVFRRIRPDIALLYTVKPNVYGNFAAALTGTKTISNIAGLGTVFIGKGPVTVLVKMLYRLALRVPARVFFQNREDMQMFLGERLVKKHAVDRLPGSGVDLNRFSPGVNQGTHPQRPFVFLLPARMLWDKGVREYVEAAEIILKNGFDAEFRLLGFMDVDNPNAVSREEMTEMTKLPGINYRGVTDTIEDELAFADCVVLPSYREGTPKALLEAAAMAKPIITTDAVGCRDVVDDGINGFFCNCADVDDLACKIKKMLQLSDAQRQQMGLQGRKKMEKEFDQEIVIGMYQQAVAAILGKG